jgi:hypothetical protein
MIKLENRFLCNILKTGKKNRLSKIIGMWATYIFFLIKPTDALIFRNLFLSRNSTCFGQSLCPSSGVYSLYTQQWCMSHRFVDSFRAGAKQFSSRSICSCSKAVYKPVWHIPLLSVQWINSWWWTEEMSETCRASWQNKFVKLVHLVGFIIKKFVTTHGHMNVK